MSEGSQITYNWRGTITDDEMVERGPREPSLNAEIACGVGDRHAAVQAARDHELI